MTDKGTNDKIIRFPGGGAKAGKDAGSHAGGQAGAREPKSAKAATGIAGGPAVGKIGKPTDSPFDGDGLTEEQRKAVGIVLSGMPFVVIGIKTTPSGADFFTSVSGEGADLRNAEPHLAGVIERALEKKGC